MIATVEDSDAIRAILAAVVASRALVERATPFVASLAAGDVAITA